MTIQVDILNPKASQLLQNLVDLQLIAIRDIADDGFLALIHEFRAKAKKNPPTLEEITKEVEIVRAKRYANAQK